MGESRGELLAWINTITQSGYTKVEQCGSGAAYCQIIDAMYGDVPMTKVKVNANQEYQYITNFKVLQKAFKDHAIDKPIPVDRLMKCKMQDNLEFLQWLKKFWDANWDGTEYDAAGRAGGQIVNQPPARAPVRVAPGRGNTPVGARAGVPASRSGSGLARNAAPAVSAAARDEINTLRMQLEDLTEHSLTLEKERDFYFGKLRNVETMIQTRLGEPEDKVDAQERATLTKLQEELYSVEDGFETPAADLEGLAIEDDLNDEQLLDEGMAQAQPADKHDEDEIF